MSVFLDKNNILFLPIGTMEETKTGLCLKGDLQSANLRIKAYFSFKGVIQH